MAVGTNMGTVYSGRQGTQFATTLGRSQALEQGLEDVRKRAAAKQDARAKAAEQMFQAKPEEVWHYYSANANKAWEDWVKDGAQIMTDQSIIDPWKSTDPKAIEWQIKGARLKSAVANINQAKDWWDKQVAAIATRGDDYTDAYKDQVRNFAKNNSFDQLASGDFELPQADFKNPSNIFSNFLVAETQRLRTELGDRPPTDREFATRTQQYFGNPENEVDVAAAKQMYNSLPEATQLEMLAVAQRNGLKYGYEGMMFNDLKNRYAPPQFNVIEKALEFAKNAPRDFNKWTKEDEGGVTKFGSVKDLANSEYPEQTARGIIGSNSWILDDETQMEALGVDMNVPRPQRRAAAIAAFAEIVKSNIPREVTSGLTREGSGPSKEELKASFDSWRLAIVSDDTELANQSARYLFGAEMDAGEVVSANVEQPGYTYEVGGAGILPPKLRDHKVLRVRFSDANKANQFAEKFLKEELYQAEGEAPVEVTNEDVIAELEKLNEQRRLSGGRELNDKERAQESTRIRRQLESQAQSNLDQSLNRLLSFYKNKSTGEEVYIPIITDQEQVLKTIHDETYRQKKQPFELIGRKYENIGIQQEDEIGFYSGKPKQ